MIDITITIGEDEPYLPIKIVQQENKIIQGYEKNEAFYKEYTNSCYKQMGFVDYKPTFNNRKYSGIIFDCFEHILPEIGADFSWLCNNFATAYKKINDRCCNNFRACKVGDEVSQQNYNCARANGCCGFCDWEITNKKTGNTYKIGFNYGH